MDSYRDVEDIKKRIWDEYRGEDSIIAVEPLIKSVVSGEVVVGKRQENGELKKMSYGDIIAEMNQDCKPFLIYKEDILLKEKFFQEQQKLKSEWTTFAEEEDKQVYTKFEDGEQKISIYCRCKIKTSIYYPIFLLSQTKHFKEWIPQVVRSEELSRVGDLRRVLHTEREFPWPFFRRDLVLAASSCFLPENKAIMMILRSVNEDRAKLWNVKLPGLNEAEVVRGDMVRLFQYIEAAGKDECWFTTYMCMDPHFSYVPDFMLNKSITMVLYVMLGKLADQQLFKDLYSKASAQCDMDLDKRIRRKLLEIVDLPGELKKDL